MGPLNIFTKILKKNNPAQNYLSLAITPNKVVACIWGLNFDQVEFLGFGQKPIVGKDLIHQTAIAIDIAAQSAKSDVEKTVFGLSNFYLEDNKPSREVSEIIKGLAEDLELSPQAFIPLAAAINHLLKIEESATPHAVLIGVFNDFCEVHIIKNNKVIATYTSKEKITIDKIENLVSRLKDEVENLPSRFIIYGIDDPELSDKIIKADWKNLFIHEPRIMILDASLLAKSVAYAQAADILGHDPTLLEVTKGQYPSPVKQRIDKVNEFGFVEGEDILLTKQQEELETPELTRQVAIPKARSELRQEDYAVLLDQPTESVSVRNKETLEDVVTVGWLPKVLGIFKKKPPVKKLAVVVALFLITILLGSFIASQTLTSAQVTIKVNAKNLEKNFKSDVVLNLPDSNASQIAGRQITTKVTGSQKAVATGSKKLGEPAHGTVSILNWTKDSKAFAKSIVIISKNGLKYRLDTDLEVASRSASTPGTTDTNVTALDLGPQGNIDAGQDFTFQEFDELLYSAHNNDAFSGGSEKQITVVVQQDLDKLEKSLSDSLTEKAKTNLKEKISGQKFHDEAIVVKVLKKEFDKKLDEEASLINLNMEIEALVIAYKESDLKNYLAQDARSDTPLNLEIRAQDIEVIDIMAKLPASPTGQKDTLELSGKYRANLIPKFNEEELAAKIAGKSIKETRTTIMDTPEVADVIVKFSPNLPLSGSLPRDKSKIKFKIEAN